MYVAADLFQTLEVLSAVGIVILPLVYGTETFLAVDSNPPLLVEFIAATKSASLFVGDKMVDDIMRYISKLPEMLSEITPPDAENSYDPAV